MTSVKTSAPAYPKLPSENTAAKEEFIASKRQISFYEECFQMFGYEIDEIKKIDRNYVISFLPSPEPLSQKDRILLHKMKEKLRIIEIIDRKKCGFNSLFLNLFAHTFLFCLQAVILYHLHLNAAHPKTMYQVGLLLFTAILLLGLLIKFIEIFRWNSVQKKLKQEISQIKNMSVTPETDTHTKVISVLFTRGHGMISELIYWCTGRQYTHASLGLDDTLDCFYSFDYRGFRTEHPAHRKLKNNQKESLCYLFKVSDDDYLKVKNDVDRLLNEQNTFRYNIIGAVFSVFHIYMPVKSHKVYFCSEFVADELRCLKSFRLKKAANMYLPTNLAKSLVSQDNMYKVFVNAV